MQSLKFCSEWKTLEIITDLILNYFFETDASGVAIGMALLQSDNNERESLYPIAYGSKTLTEAETRYANIECELLGVVGALENSTTSLLVGQLLY